MDRHIPHSHESCGYRGITHFVVFLYGYLDFRFCSQRFPSYFRDMAGLLSN